MTGRYMTNDCLVFAVGIFLMLLGIFSEQSLTPSLTWGMHSSKSLLAVLFQDP